MTTVAYKDGILAYDSKITRDGAKVGSINKGNKSDKYLVACCGDADRIKPFIDWVKADFIDSKKPKWNSKDSFSFSGLVITRDKVLLYDEALEFLEIEEKVFAMGTGEQYAYGAMHVGASAKDAVIAAAAYDGYTGGRIRTLTFENEKG